MKRQRTLNCVVAVLIALVVLSCKDNFAQVKTISQFDALPIGEADTIRVVYTELAKTIAVLTAPKNIDYTNQPFPYSEFPNGVEVVFFDENTKETLCERQITVSFIFED
jgi:hypothetical protein